MGGYIAYEILRQAPERVTRLALLDTGSRADPPERRRNAGAALIAVARRKGARAVQDAAHAGADPQGAARRQVLYGRIRQMADDTGVDAFMRQQIALMGRPDSRPFLPSIQCPTLVLVGRQDALTPVEMAQEIAAGIPGAKLEIIDRLRASVHYGAARSRQPRAQGMAHGLIPLGEGWPKAQSRKPGKGSMALSAFFQFLVNAFDR